MAFVGAVACNFGSSGICTIYSMGDGTFMHEVITAVSMLSSSNDLLMLGKIGFVLGLLLLGVRGIIHQRLDLGYMLVSIIVFGIMFGMTTTVQIVDEAGAPGVNPGATWNVSNVPYGLALAGAFISGTGKALAEEMDTAFGSVSGSGQGSNISKGGFGSSLRWINAVRNWELPEIDDTGGEVAWYKENLSNYLANCFMFAVDNGQADVGKTFMVDDPFVYGNSNTGGIGVQNQFLTTQVRDSVGVHNFPCSQAFSGLQTQTNGGTLYSKFADSIAPRGMKMPFNISVATTALNDAFNDVNLDAAKAQKYVFDTALMTAWTEMLRHNGQSSPLDTLSDIMVSQAAQQRATQWAAAESMFRRVAQPMIAFFESMFYACAPFMALCIGFGAWGYQMIMRYMILSIWVILWFPVLSIINMFQLTMVKHAVNAMTIAGTQLKPTSVAGVAYLQSQVIDWLATGALLASSTPAITLALIFGGAVSLGAIASKMGGDAHVNASAVSPDAIKNSPAFEHAAMKTGNTAGGVVDTGAAIPTIGWGANSQTGLQSAQQRAEQATDQAAHTLATSVRDTASSSKVAQVGAQASADSSVGRSLDNVAQIARRYGVDLGDSSQSTIAHGVSYSVGGDAGLSASAKAGTPGSKQPDAKGGEKPSAQASASLGGKASYNQETGRRDTDAVNVGENLNQAASKHSDLKYAMQNAFKEMATTAASQDGKLGSELAHNTGWQKSNSEASSAQDTFNKFSGFSTSSSINNSIPANVFGENMQKNDPSGQKRAELTEAATRSVGSAAVNAAYNSLSGWSGDESTKRAVAAQMALMGAPHTKPYESGGDGTVDREAAAMKGWALGGGMGSSMSGGAFEAGQGATSNSGVASGLHVHGGVREDVNSNAHGASSTPGQVESRAQSMFTHGGQEAAKAEAMHTAGVNPDTERKADAVKSADGKAATDAYYNEGAINANVDKENYHEGMTNHGSVSPLSDTAASAGSFAGGFVGRLADGVFGSGRQEATSLSQLRMEAGSGKSMSPEQTAQSEQAFQDAQAKAPFVNNAPAVHSAVRDVTAGFLMMQSNTPIAPGDRAKVQEGLNYLMDHDPERLQILQQKVNSNGLSTSQHDTAKMSSELGISDPVDRFPYNK